MRLVDFSETASRYERGALLQRSAADFLIELVGIGPEDDVLDVGCGTGQVTAKIRKTTRGRLVGIDPAEGMIREARRRYCGLGIKFEVGTAEELDYEECFDVVFSNSSFQWFANPDLALANFGRALRGGGRVGIQAPAKRDFSPTFIRAMSAVEEHPKTGPIFRHFRNPCLLLETEGEYEALFHRAGFSTVFAKLDAVKTRHAPDEAFRIFDSGAGVAYLNPNSYDVPINDEYKEDVLRLVRDAFEGQADEQAMVEIVFHRIYLVAVKP